MIKEKADTSKEKRVLSLNLYKIVIFKEKKVAVPKNKNCELQR